MADFVHAHKLGAALLSELRCRGLDLGDHLRHPLPDLSSWQILPARQRRQLQLIRRHEVAAFDGLDRCVIASRFPLRTLRVPDERQVLNSREPVS